MSDPTTLDQAWEQLTLHLEWATAFWLAFTFSDDPCVVEELRDRTRAQLEFAGRRLAIFQPSAPDEQELIALLRALLDGHPDAVAWVELAQVDAPGADWSHAWQQLCARLNQQREELRRRWPGGIMLVTRINRLDATARAAPDLWSIRALLLRIAALRREGIDPSVDPPPSDDVSEQAPEQRRLGLALQAVERARRRVEAEPGDDARAALARSLESLAVTRSAPLELAAAACGEVVDIYRSLPDRQRDLARALSNSILHLTRLGCLQTALANGREAVDLYRTLSQADPAMAPGFALALNNLASTLNELERHEEALVHTREALALRRQLAAADPERHQPALAQSLGNLGIHLARLGQYDEALTVTRESVAHLRHLVDSNPARFRSGLARMLASLASILHQRHRNEEAFALAHEALDIHRSLVGSDARNRPALARSLSTMGFILASLGRPHDARDHFAEALRIALPDFRDHPEAHLKLVMRLAYTLEQLHDSHGAAIPDDLAPIVSHLLDAEREIPSNVRDGDDQR